MAFQDELEEATAKGADYAFEAADQLAESAGVRRQVKAATGVQKQSPFGVDEDNFSGKYETSAIAGPGSWDQSMASRIARRRLIGRQASPKGPTGGSTAMVAR